MLQGVSSAEHGQAEAQFIKEENEALKKVIEQMKIDMQTIVEKVKSTVAD